jgi:predicted phage terminase large subunit-like protein
MQKDELTLFKIAFRYTREDKGREIPDYAYPMLKMVDDVEKGRVKRALINAPPRTNKTSIVTIFLSALALARDPKRRIIIVTYGKVLTSKIVRDIRKIMMSPWFMAGFPQTRISDSKNTESEFETTAGGGVLATSFEGAVTGHGADFLIIDDPHPADDANRPEALHRSYEFFLNELVGRLNSMEEGRIVVVHQRIHVDDLSGQLLRAGGWTHLKLPMIATEQTSIDCGGYTYVRNVGSTLSTVEFPHDAVEQRRREIGEARFAAQYQQDPLRTQGAILRSHHLVRLEERPQAGILLLSIDPANSDRDTASYSALQIWQIQAHQRTLIDSVRERLEYAALRDLAHAMVQRSGVRHAIIEKSSIGPALASDLAQFGVDVKLEAVHQDKIARLEAHLDKFNSGQVAYLADPRWNENFLMEVLAFPGARHSDQVDAMSQALGWNGHDGGALRHSPASARSAQGISDGLMVRGGHYYSTNGKGSSQPHPQRNPRGTPGGWRFR